MFRLVNLQKLFSNVKSEPAVAIRYYVNARGCGYHVFQQGIWSLSSTSTAELKSYALRSLWCYIITINGTLC